MQNVVITGGSSGIGAELARIYAQRGSRVALLARRTERLAEVAADVQRLGGTALVITCDVTDKKSVFDAVAQVLEQWGQIDLAIANAGVAKPVRATAFVLEDVEFVMATNFNGMINLFAAVMPGMLARKSGHFVGVASVAGLRGMPRFSAYSASKAAMQTFLEASRAELAPHGVAVTTVNPGFIATEMTAANRYKMPFLMKVEPAARVIAAGIDRRARVVQFPFATSTMMRLVRLIPDALFDRMMGAKRKLKAERS